jgi:hypothetical protein
MKERFKNILLILSVTINLGILGFLAYSWATSYFLSRGERVMPSEEIRPLKGFQAEEVVRARGILMESLREKRHEIQAKREELIKLLMQPFPDRQAINTKMREINQLQGNIQEATVKQMLFETQKMPPEQRSLYFNTIRNRMCRRGMMGMGMSGRGQWWGRGHMMGRW